MARRAFGELERRRTAAGVDRFRARYAMPDGARFSKTFDTEAEAEAWLETERAVVEGGEWTPPAEREEVEAPTVWTGAPDSVAMFAERYLRQRELKPTTLATYRRLLDSRILPRFGDVAMGDVTLTSIKFWLASLTPSTAAANAAAYRLLRSLLQAAEDEGVIVQAPPRLKHAGTAPPAPARTGPPTVEEVTAIIDALPERLQLTVILTAFAGLHENEILELRRPDADRETGEIRVTRMVDKDPSPDASTPFGYTPCSDCGRGIVALKSVRIARVPQKYVPLLRHHLVEYRAPGIDGLLFPGERTDHLTVRHLMDNFRRARAAAGLGEVTLEAIRLAPDLVLEDTPTEPEEPIAVVEAVEEPATPAGPVVKPFTFSRVRRTPGGGVEDVPAPTTPQPPPARPIPPTPAPARPTAPAGLPDLADLIEEANEETVLEQDSGAPENLAPENLAPEELAKDLAAQWREKAARRQASQD